MDMLQDLAIEVVKSCPPGFYQAQLQAEMDDGFSKIQVKCKNKDGDYKSGNVSFESQQSMHQLLMDIQYDMSHPTGYKWKSCTLVIQADGTYKLEVSYD